MSVNIPQSPSFLYSMPKATGKYGPRFLDRCHIVPELKTGILKKSIIRYEYGPPVRLHSFQFIFWDIVIGLSLYLFISAVLQYISLEDISGYYLPLL